MPPRLVTVTIDGMTNVQQVPLHFRLDAYVAALNEAHDPTGQEPGDEVVMVEPAEFSLAVIDEDQDGEWLELADVDAESWASGVFVRWSRAKGFWYAE